MLHLLRKPACASRVETVALPRQRGRRGGEDMPMDPAAARAAHGPVFVASAARGAAQDRERGAAIRTVREHRRGLQGLFGKGQGDSAGAFAAGGYGLATRGLKRSIWAFASAIAA